jgi:hypothetical protein
MMDFKITLTGTHTLLMHNAQLSDPLNPFTKRLAEITSKRKKTDDDHVEIARREWDGGLYYDADAGPFIPGQNVERALLDSARMNRLGKSIERGVFITTDVIPLDYPGPRDIRELRDDASFRHMASVKIGMSRTMRCRPMFREWSLSAEGYLDETQIELDELRQIAQRAGKLIGLGDWRPRFGRFEATVEAA